MERGLYVIYTMCLLFFFVKFAEDTRSCIGSRLCSLHCRKFIQREHKALGPYGKNEQLTENPEEKANLIEANLHGALG